MAGSGSPPMIACLVTGGAGFLGRHLVQQLLDSGRYVVTVFDRVALDMPSVTMVVGDLTKYADVEAAVRGKDVIFHVATAAPTGENALNIALMDAVNVQGTRHVLTACQALGVRKLVYTSSASVVFDGARLVNVDEMRPYAAKPMDYYTRTKIQGEQLVLAANGQQGVATVALRPSGIFGEGDQVFVPTVVRQARRGKMKYIIGSGENKMDFTYAGNVAQAHLQAAEKLTSPTCNLGGQAYFITNDDPVRFWGMMGDVCEGLGYARPRIRLPFLLIILIAFIFENVIRPLVALCGVSLASDFTVNRILIATTDRTFSCAKAKRDFGYKPKWGVKEALQRSLQSFPHLRADVAPPKNGLKTKVG